MEQLFEPWHGDSIAAGSGEEARASPRFTQLLRTAKLIVPAGEFLCVVRDVSSTGLSIRNFHAVPDGRPVTLELQSGDCHEIEKVWEREGAAGFRFTEEIDIAHFMSEQGKHPKRPVRLRIQIPILAGYCGEASEARIFDISQQGARIFCGNKLAIDQRLQLQADRLPVIQAKVRWRRGDEYGLVFENTFQFAELAKLAAQLQLTRQF